jgi:tetratricopeptide (TPR) repeat protein
MSVIENEKPEWKLDADPNRQATDALRGYVYQAWQTLHAWLDLRDGQVLYIEGAEDFDVIDEGCGRPVQVKDTHENITLRTQCVTDAITHYWQLRKAHPDKAIEFHFLTRASIGVEKNAPFGSNRAGLTLWQESCYDPTVVIELASFLREDSVLAQRLPPDLLEFLHISAPQDIHNRLIMSLKWLTGAPPVEAVTQAIDRKLINYGTKYGVLPSDCVKVADHLLREVLTVASRKTYNERQLEFADFAIIFEKTTSVSMPRNQLNALLAMQNSLGSVSMPMGCAPVLFQTVGAFSSPCSLPPLPPSIAPRSKLVEQCKSRLISEALLFISASTGMGKSTLAKLTARLFGGDWAWFSFSNFHGAHYTFALMQAARAIDDLPHDTNIILDDLVLDPSTVPEWEQILAGLLYTARARHIRVISTSRKSIPIRLRNVLGISESTEYVVPDFDMMEVKDFCVQLGCENCARVDAHAKIAFIQTSGHPQLLHARLLTLSRQGWPEVSIESLLETPDDVKEQQTQSRQLLNNLAPEEKDLLYRASVASGSFRREHIVLMGEWAKLSHPGDLFDRLVGPWIKRSADGRFEVSQLLHKAADGVWSPTTIKKLHAQMANAILSGKTLTIEDGSHVLFHALLGHNDWALMMAAKSLISDASEEVQKAVSESAFWFLHINVGDNKGQLYPSNSNVSLMLRMLQFRLCVATKPEKAVRVLDAWEEEVKHLDDSPGNLLCRGLFLFSAILYSQVTLSFTRVLELFESLSSLRRLLTTPQVSELVGPCPFTQIDKDGKSVSVFAIIFGINAMRCNSKDDLMELLNGLARLNNELRDELLSAFNLPDGYASAYVNSVYLNEGKASKPDWQSCVAVFSKAIDYATEWTCPGLGAAATRAVSIVTDEELHRSDEAMAILDSGAKLFPSHAWMLEEHRGTVLLQAKRYQEAVSVFRSALDGREDGRREFLYNPLFSFRNAGIAAAHVESWNISADFFSRGSRCAKKMNDSVLMAAFQTDAAYAYWKAEMPKEMLTSLRTSVDLIDAMTREKSNLGEFWVYRLTANTVCWLWNVVKYGQAQPELTTPMPGMCSNPDRNDKILTLPDVPFELTLYLLIMLEKALQSETVALTKYGPRLDNMSTPVIAMFMSDLRIEETFTNGSFYGLPIFVDKYVRAYLSSRKLMTEGKRAWDEIEEPLCDQQIRESLENEELLEISFFAAIFKIYSSTGTDACAMQMTEWRNSSNTLIWQSSLIHYLDRVEAILQLSVVDLLMLMNNNKAPISDRSLASLFLPNAPSDVSLRDLLQAHVILFDRFSQSCIWGKHIEKSLSALIASMWAQRAKSRFALYMPQLTVPPLLAACSEPIESFRKAATVILLAANASGIRLSQCLADRYIRL